VVANLKMEVLEIVKKRKVISEEGLLEELDRRGVKISESELNMKLLGLEILGVIRTKYSGKSKVIEYVREG